MTVLSNIAKSGLSPDLGEELVQDHSFDDDGDGWTLNEDWEIGDGLAVHHPDDDGSMQSPSFLVEAGKTYVVTIVLANTVAGSVSVHLDTEEHDYSADGSFSFDYLATEDAEATVVFFPSEDFDGAIDSASVRVRQSPYSPIATLAKS